MVSLTATRMVAICRYLNMSLLGALSPILWKPPSAGGLLPDSSLHLLWPTLYDSAIAFGWPSGTLPQVPRGDISLRWCHYPCLSLG